MRVPSRTTQARALYNKIGGLTSPELCDTISQVRETGCGQLRRQDAREKLMEDANL